MIRVVVFSGGVASGKTRSSELLVPFGGTIVKTRDILARGTTDTGRYDLQETGERMDGDNPTWLAEVIGHMPSLPDGGFFVVDAARTEEQVQSIRQLPAWVFHVHLTASREDIQSRWASRGDPEDLARVIANRTEAGVPSLAGVADLVIDTSRNTLADVRARLLPVVEKASRMPTGKRGSASDKLVDVLIGAQYGSEGKGHVAAHLAPDYDVLLRVGGTNAGHTVIHDGGRSQFIFKSLPSGTLANPEALIALGPGTNLREETLLKEIEYCTKHGALRGGLCIDPHAMMITDADVDAEEAVKSDIGSTAQGVGNATARRILERGRSPVMAKDVKSLSSYIKPTTDVMEQAYMQGKRSFLEGTQGTGLSLYHGKYPYVTSRDTTASGTLGEAGIAPTRVGRVIMVVRTNPIRVQSPDGATSGPMSNELSWEDISGRSGVDVGVLRKRETTSTTHRQRRVAEFDWDLLRRSTQLNGPTDIALTFVDYIDPVNASARQWSQLTPKTRDFIHEIERVSGVQVSMVTTRFHIHSIIDRRNGGW